MRRLFALLFGLSLPVSRKTYFLGGVSLMVLKYFGDVAIYYAASGQFLTVLEFLSPLALSREHLLRSAADIHLWLAAAWALPFMWVGASMSMRRLIDAGTSPWHALWFFVPAFNYVLMAALCFSPSAAEPLHRENSKEIEQGRLSFQVVLKGALFGLMLTAAMTAFSVLVLGTYGNSLFIGTPFVIGVVTAFILNREARYPIRTTLGATFWSLIAASLGVMLFGLEGAICIVMAFPIALIIGFMGALLGRSLAGYSYATKRPLSMLIGILPILATGDASFTQSAQYEVRTSIQIEASPAEVWPHVIGFAKISAPPPLVLTLGIAYPLYASIEGRGVGAIRRCEFTTGAFVEPITAWEEPTRLAFDVQSQPPPLTELSPYRHIHPPHLDGYFRSKRGEFRLLPLASGATRLEGSTWYELDLHPKAYWRLWSHSLLHVIHRRVLEHIKREVEGS